jgi:hypothetical protein
MSNRTDIRTTVALAEVVWKMAEKMMEAKGFNKNFSSYVADLIRRDREAAAESHIYVAEDTQPMSHGERQPQTDAGKLAILAGDKSSSSKTPSDAIVEAVRDVRKSSKTSQ